MHIAPAHREPLLDHLRLFVAGTMDAVDHLVSREEFDPDVTPGNAAELLDLVAEAIRDMARVAQGKELESCIAQRLTQEMPWMQAAAEDGVNSLQER